MALLLVAPPEIVVPLELLILLVVLQVIVVTLVLPLELSRTVLIRNVVPLVTYRQELTVLLTAVLLILLHDEEYLLALPLLIR